MTREHFEARAMKLYPITWQAEQRAAYVAGCMEMVKLAIDFHKWVEANEWEVNTREQKTHTPEELFVIYQSYQK